MLELFFNKLDDRVIFGCGLDEFQEQAVFAVVDDTGLESLSNVLLLPYEPLDLQDLQTVPE